MATVCVATNIISQSNFLKIIIDIYGPHFFVP